MSQVRSRLAGLVAAALAAAAGLVGLSAGPAAAALCSGSGVNVLVDFNGLGGGVQKGCAAGGAGRPGNEVFPAAGFKLTYAQREPGFVCRVQNAPKSDPCGSASPTNAYWGLYWSNGKSGKWAYSSSGVGGTKVPNGGFLAFSWQNGGSADPPGAAPVNNKPAPAPKPKPTKKATRVPTKQATKQSNSASGSTNVKAPEQATPGQPMKTQAAAKTSPQKKKAAKAKRARASKRAKASPSASASRSASESAAPEASDDASPAVTSAKPVDSAFAPQDEPGGLPVWVPVVVILALAGSAGGAAWWRRRTGTS
jgi:hypothetical protein